MRQAIIRLANRRSQSHHLGLLLQRYLSRQATGEGGDPEEKRALLDAACQASRSEPLRGLYQNAFDRWDSSFPKDESQSTADLRTVGRLIVGLGAENVLEAGIRLQHTYGVPVIPGSALKGLAAHFCDRVWGQAHLGHDAPIESKRFRRECSEADLRYHNLLFGTTDEGGVIAFHDAWLTPGSLSNAGLMKDVMTPHHLAWQTNEAAPTDFDNPTPVGFLSVSGTFRVRISWAGPPDHVQAMNWTALTMRLLKDALAEWGVGGKTSSGYGRLIESGSSSGPLRQDRAQEPLAKRQSGTATKVKLIATRAKGGFDVQEPGRPQGTLTLGTPAEGVQTELGAEVEVLVHNDDPTRPQYRWPTPSGGKKR